MTTNLDVLLPLIALSVLVLFIIDILAIAVMNPAVLVDSPSAENSMETIDQNAGRALAIFALVLVVIQLSLDGDTLTYYENLSLITLVLSAGFLIVAFVLELIADFKIILFRIQITSLRYSGILLFSGLTLILYSKNIPGIVPTLFGIFVSTTWIIWIIHELHYIFITQRKDWNMRKIRRRDYFCNIISSSCEKIRNFEV